MSKVQIWIALDIEPVPVLGVEVSKAGNLHIKLERSLNFGYCRQCGQRMTKLHSVDEWVKVQPLPSFGRAVFLYYRPKGYACPDCKGTPRRFARPHERHG